MLVRFAIANWNGSRPGALGVRSENGKKMGAVSQAAPQSGRDRKLPMLLSCGKTVGPGAASVKQNLNRVAQP